MRKAPAIIKLFFIFGLSVFLKPVEADLDEYQGGHVGH